MKYTSEIISHLRLARGFSPKREGGKRNAENVSEAISQVCLLLLSKKS